MSGALIDLRLRQIRLEARDIWSYEFVPVKGEALPRFAAGAHIDLHLPEGRVRSYSLVNPPSETHRYVIAVQREAEGRGGSAWMHDSLRVGHVIHANEPSNDFPLDEQAGHSVFIAGGIGITPVMSMIARLNAVEKPWRLHYASRSPDMTAFIEDLKALDRGRGRVEFSFGSDRAERLDIASIVKTADAGTHLYCCGPARMIDSFVDAGQGRPAGSLHYERFAASEAAANEGGFAVRLHRSGRRIQVVQGMTILDALLDADVAVPYACSNGICGTCMTRVIAGVPDHRDDFLSDEEKKLGQSILVCCSGSKTPELVLDL